jgi:hypothetical protein
MTDFGSNAANGVGGQNGAAGEHTSIGPGADLTVCGYTGDKGVSSRIENFISSIEDVPNSAVAGRLDKFRVRVRAPLFGCGVFSPCTPTDIMSQSNPMQNSMLALAHISSLQVDILFQGLRENLIRNISARLIGAGNALVTGDVAGGIQVALSTAKPPQLLCRWIRLPSWSGIPSSINCQTYRIATHTATSKVGVGTVDIDAAVTRASVNRDLVDALPCVGVGRKRGSRCAQFSADKYLTAEWKNVVTSQPPQYLAFMLSKSSDQLCSGGVAADDSVGRQIADWEYAAGQVTANGDLPHGDGRKAGLLNYFGSRNSDALACITQFELRVQTSIGAYTYAADAFPFIRNRQQLWRDHLRSCVDGYCNGSFAEYSKHSGMLLLSSDLWLRGISSPNTSFPLTLSAKARFESRREYVDGHSSAAVKGRFPAIQQDCIFGEPVMLMIYTGGSLQISPSSALLTSANLSHAQSLDILSRG